MLRKVIFSTDNLVSPPLKHSTYLKRLLLLSYGYYIETISLIYINSKLIQKVEFKWAALKTGNLKYLDRIHFGIGDIKPELWNTCTDNCKDIKGETISLWPSNIIFHGKKEKYAQGGIYKHIEYKVVIEWKIVTRENQLGHSHIKEYIYVHLCISIFTQTCVCI